jgi:hippurate hydrolase
VIVDEETFTPACFNHPGLTRAAADVFAQILGKDQVIEQPPEMGGEDFGQFARHLGVPGLQYSLGTISQQTYEASLQPDAEPLPSLHSSKYKPDYEPSIRSSVNTMATLTLSLLDAHE